jgi:hypothetical protein
MNAIERIIAKLGFRLTIKSFKVIEIVRQWIKINKMHLIKSYETVDDVEYFESMSLKCDKCGKTKYAATDRVYLHEASNLGWCEKCYKELTIAQ